MNADFHGVALASKSQKTFIEHSKKFICMEILIALFAIGGLGLLILRHNARVQAARDRLMVQQTFEHISCPIMVAANFPGDETVHLRAQAWRENLRAAGNRYAETLPIIVYPYALTADKSGGLSSWRAYQINAAQKFAAALYEWDAKIAAENPAMQSEFIFNQRAN